jgi:hypothetical protein
MRSVRRDVPGGLASKKVTRRDAPKIKSVPEPNLAALFGFCLRLPACSLPSPPLLSVACWAFPSSPFPFYDPPSHSLTPTLAHTHPHFSDSVHFASFKRPSFFSSLSITHVYSTNCVEPCSSCLGQRTCLPLAPIDVGLQLYCY